MPYTAYNSVAQLSFMSSGGVAMEEQYIPLWMFSTNVAGLPGGSAGSYFLQKGSSGYNSNVNASQTVLLTLSSSWPSKQSFAFECSLFTGGATAYVALWDITSNSIISASQVSTTSTTSRLVRSNTFTLNPGHKYTVTGWTSDTSKNCLVSKAHLIAINY